mgnify:CR=1 FL=1|tara:strand:+ start:1849 stop:3894 length:2046 start_codon:yes stop_codon:yes gene_type:complete
MADEKVDLSYLNRMYLCFSVTLKSNESKFNNKKLSNRMYKPEIKKLSTALKDSNFKDMFLKSIKKQDVEVVIKFRNLIELIDKRIELVNKKLKEIEDGEVKEGSNPASQEKIDVLRRIIDEPSKTLDEMEIEVYANTIRARKNINLLTRYGLKVSKDNNVIENTIKSISKDETLYSILKKNISEDSNKDSALEALKIQISGDGESLSFFTKKARDNEKKQLAELLYDFNQKVKGNFNSLEKTIKHITDLREDKSKGSNDSVIKEILEILKGKKDDFNNIVKEIQALKENISKQTQTNQNKLTRGGELLKKSEDFLKNLKSLLKELENPSAETITIRFEDIKNLLQDRKKLFSKQDKKVYSDVLVVLHEYMVRLLRSENSESRRIDSIKNEYSSSDQGNMASKSESDQIKSFIRSQIGNVIGINSIDNLKDLRETINMFVIKSPLVENSEFRYDNIERLELCAKELTESLSGSVFSVPLFLPLSDEVLDQQVGKSLTQDEKIALITSNMASLNAIIKNRKVFRDAVSENTIIRTFQDALKKNTRKYLPENIKYLLKTLLNKDTILIDGESYKGSSLSIPSISEIQSAIDEYVTDNQSKIYKSIMIDGNNKCDVKQEDQTIDIQVGITLYSEKLTNKEVKTRKCNVNKRRIQIYTDYLIGNSDEYRDIGQSNVLNKLQAFVNK